MAKYTVLVAFDHIKTNKHFQTGQDDLRGISQSDIQSLVDAEMVKRNSAKVDKEEAND